MNIKTPNFFFSTKKNIRKIKFLSFSKKKYIYIYILYPSSQQLISYYSLFAIYKIFTI